MVRQSKRIPREYRNRRYPERKGEGEPLLPSTVRTQLTKRSRHIPLSIVRTTNYQYGRVMKRKRREDIPDSNTLRGTSHPSRRKFNISNRDVPGLGGTLCDILSFD